jgi:hypothetical protein
MPWNHPAAVYRDQGLVPPGWESVELERGGHGIWCHKDGEDAPTWRIDLGDGGAAEIERILVFHGLDAGSAAKAAQRLFEHVDKGPPAIDADD